MTSKLLEEINKLKNQQIADEKPTKAETLRQTTNLLQAISKKLSMACDKQRPVRNIGLITIINFMKETRRQLSKYLEQ